MRIAILTQSYTPIVSGAALVAQRVAEGYASRGHEVLVIMPAQDGRITKQTKRNLTLSYVSSQPNPLRPGEFFYKWPQPAIDQQLAEFAPHAIHVHDQLQSSWSAAAHRRVYDTPIILTSHALPWYLDSYLPSALTAQTQKFAWSYLRWLYPHMAVVVAPSQMAARSIQQRANFPAITISNGVDMSVYKPPVDKRLAREFLCKRFSVPTSDQLILYVGRLDPDKQVDAIVRASAAALRCGRARLLLAGDGTERDKILGLTRELGIADRCHLPGYVRDPAQLACIYQAGSVFAFAGEQETQGITLLEAAASGLPIVASDATCVSEVVHDGLNGRLFQPGDIASMSAALEVLVQQPELAFKMGAAGLNIARQHSLDATISRYEELALETAAANRNEFIFAQ